MFSRNYAVRVAVTLKMESELAKTIKAFKNKKTVR